MEDYIAQEVRGSGALVDYLPCTWPSRKVKLLQNPERMKDASLQYPCKIISRTFAEREKITFILRVCLRSVYFVKIEIFNINKNKN